MAKGQATGVAPTEVYAVSAKVSVKDKDTGESTQRAVEVVVNPGLSLNEAVNIFGEDLVLSIYHHGYENKAENALRSLLRQGKTEEDIQKYMATFDPSRKRARGKSKVERGAALAESMSIDEIEEMEALLARLKNGA